MTTMKGISFAGCIVFQLPISLFQLLSHSFGYSWSKYCLGPSFDRSAAAVITVAAIVETVV